MARSKTGLSFRLSSAIGTCGILIVPMFLSTSCSIGKITFANFESYMDSDLIKRYSSQASFVYYSTNEDIELKFKKSYDIAVPTCYEVLNLLRKDELERIDWPKFNLNYNQGEEIIQNGDEVEENLLTLPTEIGAGTGSNCTEIVQAVSAYALRKNIFPEWYLNWCEKQSDVYEPTILDFAIPYLLQNVTVQYKGQYIEPIDFSSHPDWNPTWNKQADNIWQNIVARTSSSSPYFDNRFAPKKNKNKIGLVDDARTAFDISSALNCENNGITPNINPPHARMSIQEDINMLNTFAGNYNGGQFLLNSDSMELQNDFGDKNNLSSCLISYNGDQIVAALGNGISADEKYWLNRWADDSSVIDGDNFGGVLNAWSPNDSPISLDMVVINKNHSDSKTDEIYSILDDILLDGVDYGNEDQEPIWTYDDEKEKYTYDVMNNFKWNLYNSPWRKVDEYVAGEEYDNEYKEFFIDYVSEMCENYGIDPECTGIENFIHYLKYLYKIDFDPGLVESLIEEPLGSLDVSNIFCGWMNVRKHF